MFPATVAHDFATRFQTISERQRTDPVRIITVQPAAPHHSADFSWRSTGVTGFRRKAKIMRASLFSIFESGVVIDCDPTRVLGKVLRLAVKLQIIEMDRQELPPFSEFIRPKRSKTLPWSLYPLGNTTV